ncbi:MAL1 glucosidase, partial [Acromyrmex heyeri]
MLRLYIFIVTLIVLITSAPIERADKNWFKNNLIYLVYSKSFEDSDGDGIGDLNSITNRLEHITDIGSSDASPENGTRKKLSFGLDRSFRTDAIGHLFENACYLDKLRKNMPGMMITKLDYICTGNLPETYEVYWIITVNAKMIYNKSSPKVSLDFTFIFYLNNESSAADFKYLINRWMNNIPNDSPYVGNWVVNNHDNHRAASRLGEKRTDQLSVLATVLPGVSVIYNGNEIGMVDRNFTYAETKDPIGCIVGPDTCHE